MLVEKGKLLEASLLSHLNFAPFAKVEERVAWQNLPDDLRKLFINKGEGYLGYQWPSLPATYYMEFTSTGNRIRFEELYFERRNVLATLAVAECLEGQGRFVDDLINGIWLICEESTWILPAHNDQQPLPNILDESIDLFQAETAALLAWTNYLLKSILDEKTPLISQRIQYELQIRIIEPYLKNNYSWSSLANNWNTWINSNCLTIFLLTKMEQNHRLAGILKVLASVDYFLENYPTDGGCDEGPFYWGRAGGSLFDLLEQLFLATNGEFTVYQEPIIQNIGRYLYRVNIAEDYYVNFADSSGKVAIDAALVYLYGKRINDQHLLALGAKAQLHQGVNGILSSEFLSLFRVLIGIFNYQEMITFANENPDYYVRDVWLDRIQVMASREKADSTVGFYLAAKGGNNHESHNHNDVGSFLLYHDGEPLFIDVGVGEYTAQTFSEQRYTIWTMQSAYHNLPTIGQTQQQAGKEFQAKHVDYSAAPEKVRFSLDISDCYPDSAKLKFWQRSYLLKRTLKPSFTIIDQFELEEAQVITINYMLSQEPYQLTDRVIKLSSTKDLVMIYDPKIFRVKWERIPINDQRLSPVWGEAIFRLLLITKMPISEGNWRFEVLECEKSR